MAGRRLALVYRGWHRYIQRVVLVHWYGISQIRFMPELCLPILQIQYVRRCTNILQGSVCRTYSIWRRTYTFVLLRDVGIHWNDIQITSY